MTTETLTGQRRFRAEQRAFRSPLMVLQVQERRRGLIDDEIPFDELSWRDATVEDITTLIGEKYAPSK